MAWTAEQEDAINARGSSILVSAAAGSGKTSVLVERLIRQLSDAENRIPADRMIVVTFTRDAAAEMKQRLSAALAVLSSEHPEDQWLSRQQLLLESAKISTIHSFCFDLIRDNIHELELPANFRIMDENEAALMVSGAVSDILGHYYEKYPEKTELLYDQFCSKDDSVLEKLISEIYEFICSVPYGINWLKKCCEGYSENGTASEMLYSEYEKYIMSLIRRAYELSAECTGLVSEGGSGKCVDIIDTEYMAINRISEMFSAKDRSLKEKALSYYTPEFARLTFPKDFDPDIKEKIQNLRDQYKEIMKEQLRSAAELVSYSEEDISMHYSVLNIITDMISDLDERLWKIKTEKGCIGFSDAETIAVKLLSSVNTDGSLIKTPLADELSDYYKIIMIDEFQDTNNNQDLIFRLLSHNGTADKNGDNLFMVGDVKQSIYRFRLANPKIFINTMRSSVKYNERTENDNAYIQLNRNFRSSDGVIGFVNFIFRSVMSPRVGDIEYSRDEELIQGAEFTDRPRKTQITLLHQDSDDDFAASAIYTAEKISSMIKNKVQVDNRDKVSTRDCTYRDFCILLRRKSDAEDYVKELARRGIPAYSEETSGYLRSREISVLLNILRITDNPLLDTAFVSVMLSPMFMITDDEIALIRLSASTGHIYNAVQNILEKRTEEMISYELMQKLENIQQTINELRMYAATMDLAGLIRRIYDRTDFISVIRMYDSNDKKRANLRVLFEYAKMYQSSSDDGLSGFLRYIDRMLKINGDFRQGQTVSTSEDVVMIKTIHKSKGLEFPFVFLCESQVSFNTADSRKNIQMNFENGIGFRLQNRSEYQRYQTLPYAVLNNINRSDSVSEEMRLLYVALTRAKEQLFIPLIIGKSQKNRLSSYAPDIYQYQGITDRLAAGASSMSDWILMALMTHRDGKVLREMSDYDMFWVSDDVPDIEIENISTDEMINPAETENDQSDENIIQADDRLVNEITQSFGYSYDISQSHLQAKVSVSDISKDHDKFGHVMKRPAFASEKKGLTGSEKGTIIHSILQHSDFIRLGTDPQGEIEKCIEKGFISERYREYISSDLIKSFTDSEIYKRAVSSLRVEREKKFLVRICDLELPYDEFALYKNSDSMVQGIADMYFEESDGLVLVDYKTDNISDPERLAENYSMQIALYRAAIEKTECIKVKQALLFSLKLGKFIEVKI